MSDQIEVKASFEHFSPNHKRRKLIKAAGGAAVLGPLGFPSVHAKSKATLRFLNDETSVDSIRSLRVAAAEYERKFGTKVIIDSVPIDGVFPKIEASIKAGQPYDLATIAFVGHMIILANQGNLIPLTEMTKKHQWGPKVLFPIKGEVFWYPFDYNLPANYYRKDLYAEKGLKIPETWEQYLSNARALTVMKDGNVDRGGCISPIASNGATNWTSTGFLWAEGVRILDKNWNVILDNAENTERVSRYLDLYEELYKTMPPNMNSASYAQLLGLFVTDKVAHTAYSGRLVEVIEARNPSLADKFGIFPYMNSTGGTHAVTNTSDGFVVLKSKQSEEAMKFLRWFVEDRYIDWLHTAPIHFQPPRLDIYEDKRWWAHPLIEKHAETVKIMQSWITDKNMVIHSIDTDGPTPDVRPAKVFESYAFPEMLQNKVLKGMSNADCVKAAAEKIRQVITS